MSKPKLFHLNDFDFNQLKLNPVLYKNDNLILNFYINDGDTKITPLFFIDKLDVIKFTNKIILLNLSNNNDIVKFFTNLEHTILNLIKESEIIKKYKLKNYSFISLVNNYTSKNDENFDILKLNVSLNEEFGTSLFYRYGNPVVDIAVMNTTISVKTIFELISIIFDTKQQEIIVNNCCRQIKVKQKHEIINRLKDLSYSFIDSDDNNPTNENVKKINNENKNSETDPQLTDFKINDRNVSENESVNNESENNESVNDKSEKHESENNESENNESENNESENNNENDYDYDDENEFDLSNIININRLENNLSDTSNDE